MKLNIIGDPGSYKVEPLIFSVLLENAFKHGLGNKNGGVIDIKFQITDNGLFFVIKNPVSKDKKGNNYPRLSGVGLKNIRKRLKLIYPNQHRLNIYRTEDNYVVELFLKLTTNEVSNH